MTELCPILLQPMLDSPDRLWRNAHNLTYSLVVFSHLIEYEEKQVVQCQVSVFPLYRFILHDMQCLVILHKTLEVVFAPRNRGFVILDEIVKDFPPVQHWRGILNDIRNIISQYLFLPFGPSFIC